MFGLCFVILFKIVLCIVLKTEIREFSFEVDLLNSQQNELAMNRAFSVQSSPFVTLFEGSKRPDDAECGLLNEHVQFPKLAGLQRREKCGES